MKRVLAALLLLAPAAAAAQSMLIGVDRSGGGAPAYTGPGDVVSGAKAWWGLRAYNGAYASGLNKIANICTPADAVCADVNSDASGNFNLAGTGSLTCNNSGSICTIKTLYDQSGASSCSGPCDVTQATIANRPILVVPGAANGCPTTAKFCMSTTGGGAQSLVGTAGMATTTSQPYTISIVYNNPVRTGDEYLLDTNFGQPGVVSGFGGANLLIITAGSGTPNAAASDGSYHATQSVFNNTSSDINVDGTQNTVSVGTAAGANTITVVLLNFSGPTGGTGSFGGFSQEFGLWPIGFTPTNSSNISTNQHTYWGF